MIVRYSVKVQGIVQGVGYRPFVYSLATHMGLSGWVINDARGVLIEVQGNHDDVKSFIDALYHDAPALAVVEQINTTSIDVVAENGFCIRSSQKGQPRTLISPDIALCDDCIKDMNNSKDRRYRYAFTNCTNCGPRFTIINSLPYDRCRTSMHGFTMCTDCADEYNNPLDRRFHAQPVACPACGPKLLYRDASGKDIAGDPLTRAVDLLKQGKILAVKGLGGFHLACDAFNEAAVGRLRLLKGRNGKPLAVMAADISTLEQLCLVSDAEKELLLSPQRPIVLLKKNYSKIATADNVAPDNTHLGCMLPYTPVHYLLMEHFKLLVMTSGNISEEPIVYQDSTAFDRLNGLADGFLFHDREIVRCCDDSVVRLVGEDMQFIRRSRGYVPHPLHLENADVAVLACGGEQKNTFCLLGREYAFVSQHIGDMENIATLDVFEQQIIDFEQMFDISPQAVACDMHPEYLSTKYGEKRSSVHGLRKIAVQHHHAHMASVMGEWNLHEPMLGLVYDGTGYGTDGTLWGGEVLLGDRVGFSRKAHLLPMHLPGGSAAIREPWRIALSCLYSACVNDGYDLSDMMSSDICRTGWQNVLKMLQHKINAPLSSGMGRLFDAVAALCGIYSSKVSYEGQAAVVLEQIAGNDDGSYNFILNKKDGMFVIDWRPLILQVVFDLKAGCPVSVISARFHNAIANISLKICQSQRADTNINKVALSGGCWQNVLLFNKTVALLKQDGFEVYTNRKVPVNDGGLSFGQAVVAAAIIQGG